MTQSDSEIPPMADEHDQDYDMEEENVQQAGSPEGARGAAAKTRKRTKTGCLTCRKRRVKCGEERPICANCLKSKRNCEGYAPRLTFKDPMSAYAQGWPMRGYAVPPEAMQYMQQNISPATGHPQFPLIAPRPIPEQAYYTAPYPIPPMPPGYSSNAAVQSQPVVPLQYHSHHHYLPIHSGAAPQSHHLNLTGPSDSIYPYTTDVPSTSSVAESGLPATSTPRPYNEQQTLPRAGDSYHRNNDARQIKQQQQDQISQAQSYIPRGASSTMYPPAYVPGSSQSIGAFKSLPDDFYQRPTPTREVEPIQEQQHQDHGRHPAIDRLHEEEEYYDVDSDEEMADVTAPTPNSIQKRQRDLTYVLAVSGTGRNMRSVEAFLHQPNVLATYAPRYSTSPLMDEATARIFCHFVTATGPLMSAYGRHPVNPALLFSGTPVPKSQQALWTYTIPMMAISNQALLHAILAVASLNIARLQQAPLTVPIKHYQFALRRVAKAVATPSKRTAMATVAATILLSQFEILSAEHSKWHSHLAGARQLLTEINFAQWTDRIHQERVRRAALDKERNGNNGNTRREIPNEDLPWIPEPGTEDEKILTQLVGSSLRKDFHGKTQRSKAARSSQPVTEKEMDDFQTYRDLFWMYAKIDNIQSFVSGRRLLLPFDRWVHCPPRAPMNRFDAVYGTLDHVSLLLGRVADFAGTDVARKRRAVKANGGVWRPSPGMFGPPGAMPPGTMPPGMMPPGFIPGTSMRNGSVSTTSIPENMMSPQGSTGGLLPGFQMPSPPGAPGMQSMSSETMNFNTQMPTPSSSESMPSTPGQAPNTGSPPTPGPRGMPATPNFSGLMPNTKESTNMPAAFSQAPRDVLYQQANEVNIELAEATREAQAEWNSIQEAFDAFEGALGPAFQPLAADVGPVIDTPFGPAMQYRTFQIATGWLLFYMAKIISIRTHPAMPPASMVAAGVAAAKTAKYCNIIGRINLGLQTPAPHQPLNPIFGGAITEMMLPMFVAGVQYMDNAQRIATVERLQFIADRIGHDSAALIAAGLEKTWIRMHEAGRGPPYKPSVRVTDEYGRDLTERQWTQPDGSNGDIRVPRGPARDLNGRETSKNKNRGAVILQKDTRSFAAGVMGLEEPFSNLNMNEPK